MREISGILQERIDFCAIEYTSKPVGVEIEIENGISGGNLKNPDSLIEAAKKLISKGAQAIALVCFFGSDYEDDNYSAAKGIDPIGGVEAVISHLITREFSLPCAHAPAFSEVEISQKPEHPKVSSELISSTYFPCVAMGLSIAPKITKELKNSLNYKDIEYLIVPHGALGSKSILQAAQKNIKIITVKNKTMLDVTKDKLNIEVYKEFDNYEECLWEIRKIQE